MSKTILVTGATGRQGGAVIRAISALPSPDFNIFALTRDINSQSSLGLLKQFPSINLVGGDLNNPKYLRQLAPLCGVSSASRIHLARALA
ncbi:hypothetical protein BDW75DRAFT_57056 [Aspergillus navahoensis]